MDSNCINFEMTEEWKKTRAQTGQPEMGFVARPGGCDRIFRLAVSYTVCLGFGLASLPLQWRPKEQGIGLRRRPRFHRSRRRSAQGPAEVELGLREVEGASKCGVGVGGT